MFFSHNLTYCISGRSGKHEESFEINNYKKKKKSFLKKKKIIFEKKKKSTITNLAGKQRKAWTCTVVTVGSPSMRIPTES